VFQALPHTVGFDDAQWRVLATCHERRNRDAMRCTADCVSVT
jgi:hypothetical protein